MAAPSSSNTLTFGEMVKRMTKDEVRAIIELVAQENMMIASSMVKEGNETDGNTTVVRETQPTGTWTSMSEGVQPEASATREIWDAAGMLEGYSVIPMRYLDKSPNSAAAREQEITSFVQGFAENVEDKIFYGDRNLDPKQFFGLDQRFSLLGGETGGQIIDGGGTGTDNTDIWFVCWGDAATSLFFGANGTAGMQVRNRGIQTLDRYNDGTLQECAVTYFGWEVGLMVEDYRSIARVANLDTSLVIAGTKTGQQIVEDMIDAYFAIPNRFRTKRKTIYCNRTIVAALTKGAQAQANNNLSMANWEGTEIVHFMGIPIIQSDSITGTGLRVI